MSVGMPALFAFLMALLIWPLMGLAFGWFSSDGSSFSGEAFDLWKSDRMLQMLGRSAVVALGSSVLCVLAAVGLSIFGESVSKARREGAIVLCLFASLITPYVSTQGYISLLGEAGPIWTWLEIGAPFDIYSERGLIVLLSFSLFPWAFALVGVGSRRIGSRVGETLRMHRASRIEWLQLYYIPKYTVAAGAAFLLVFMFSFWAYEIPSMLRVNLMSIELMAAFGSFYDFRSALALAIGPLAVSAILIGALFRLYTRLDETSTRSEMLGETSLLRARWFQVGIGGYLLLAVVLPAYGLVIEVGSWQALRENLIGFRSEIASSASVGLVSLGVALALSVYAIGALRFENHQRLIGALAIVATVLLCLPDALKGMGAAYFFSQPWMGPFSGGQGFAIGIASSLPLALLAAWIIWSAWSDRQNEWSRSCRIGYLSKLRRLAIPIFADRFVLLGAIAFAWTTREVPSTLLNHPPGGATLAVSIETLLHFEQPDKVASLCLAQLGLTVCVFAVAFGLRALFSRPRFQ